MAASVINSLIHNNVSPLHSLNSSKVHILQKEHLRNIVQNIWNLGVSCTVSWEGLGMR